MTRRLLVFLSVVTGALVLPDTSSVQAAESFCSRNLYVSQNVSGNSSYLFGYIFNLNGAFSPGPVFNNADPPAFEDMYAKQLSNGTTVGWFSSFETSGLFRAWLGLLTHC